MVEVEYARNGGWVLEPLYQCLQAMGGGGPRVSTENVIPEEAESSRLELNKGRYVKCVVADTGVGVDRDTLKKIFDPFFTTKQKGIGTGLGLTAVYSVVRNSGGCVKADNKKGERSIFTIYLPVSKRIPPS